MKLRKLSFTFFFILSTILFFFACQSERFIQKSPNNIDFALVPYPNISDYGFFLGEMKKMLPNERVLIYEPSSALFTDYATKSRFVWMAEGASASILENEWQELDFPDKSILIKNFYYPDADGVQRIIETRLLVKNEGEWNAYPYLWNEEQTDAPYKITGAAIPISFNHGGEHYDIKYIVPNKNQCKSCHNQDEELMPIGPKGRNLNFELDYGNGEVKNQLAKWQEVGYISNYDNNTRYQTVPNYEHTEVDLNNRARAYLDANCGFCHNPRGPASTSGLTLTYEEQDTNKLGYFKTPVAAGFGAGELVVDLHPGKADSSILVYRMNSVTPGVIMPEIGRTMIHKEAVELISAWINGLGNAN